MSAIYRKGEVLGWGGVATVYKGWDELLDRPVAIKELVQPFAGHDPFVRTFIGQALRMVDIAHRHVLATYGVETGRTPPAILREVAEETVGHQLMEGPIAPEEVLRILRHILAGLAVIHGRELLHRAVKPENFFVFGDVYKIGDFGIPAVESGPPVPERRLKYMAPEVLDGSEPESPASDLYSLGLVIHELLLGSVRFEQTLEKVLQRSGILSEGGWNRDGGDDDVWSVFNRATVELPPLHEIEPSIPVALSLTLQRMVRKSPAARYGSCREVLAALGAAGLVEVLGGSQGVTVPASVLAPVAKPPSPARQSGHPMVWVGGGAVAALLIAGGAWFAGTHSGHGETSHAGIIQSAGEGQTVGAPLGGGAGASLADALRALRSDRGLSLDLDATQSGEPSRLALSSPLNVRVSSDRSAHLAFFGLSSDGEITCLYPNDARPVLKIRAGSSVLLPTLEDQGNGFGLYASKPLGRQLLFVLASDEPLPKLPEGTVTSRWFTEYAAVPAGAGSPARLFVDWVVRLRREHPDGTRLAMREIEVVAGP